MKRTLSTWLLCLAGLLAWGETADGPGQETDERRADPATFLEEVTIVGSRADTQGIAGAAHFIGEEEIAKFAQTDVQSILRRVPGVSMQLEDGFGLRPNISIRGVASERSGRITLLEDGVLIAPAPYSAPSAYYFPTAGRMAAFEVLKGPAAITQGPYTIGGALNMISTPVPAARVGRLFAETGEYASNRLHASYGATLDSGFGFMAETHLWMSDGFQTIDRSPRDSGLNVRDYTLKLGYQTGAHHVELKLQKADQTSNQSYLGLTDADFRANPTRRYGISQLDRIETDHEQIILNYHYEPVAHARFELTLYDNRHARDWFKTEGVDLDGSPNAQSFSRVSWASVVQAVNFGDPIRGWSAARLADLLVGAVDTPTGGIQLRSNDRQYYSRGAQIGSRWTFDIGGVAHKLEAGIRLHEDEEDRLQRNSTYSQRDGTLRLDDRGILGNAGNRIQSAQALALFVQHRMRWGAWTFIPGLRYEDIDQSRVRFETRGGRTVAPSARTAENRRDMRSNRTTVLLPGFGALYQIRPSATLLASVHKGFTAPSNAPDVNPEEALNYELGLRFDVAAGRLEAVAFLSDYDNLLGECTSSSGVNCEVGDAFNGDAATVKGLELLFAGDFVSEAGLRVPLTVAYTWIDGTFDTDIADTNFFGDVRVGDPLPYIPDHQLYASIGVGNARWEANLAANFVGSACTRPSCRAFESTEDSLTVDVSGRYFLNDAISFFARVENVADARDIVGRHPYGARPNKSRTAALGIELAW